MGGDASTVKALLKQGADVNAAQGDGMTALHWAARQGDVDLSQMLIYAGANVRAATRLGGFTPLLMASERGYAGVIDVLLKAGADPKIATASGTTPLMFASASGKTDAIKLLLDKGADVSAREATRGVRADQPAREQAEDAELAANVHPGSVGLLSPRRQGGAAISAPTSSGVSVPSMAVPE